jgi:hypothetical protein
MSYFTSESIDASVIRCLLGEGIGRGSTREVFTLQFDQTKVVKIEDGGLSFANVQEYALWEEVKHTTWKRWFAPVYGIDTLGTALVQARTSPLSDREWGRVKVLPNFFTDLKKQNFGMLNGKVVCHDYALNLIACRGLRAARMRNVEKELWSLSG